MTDMITGLISAINTLVTGLFSTTSGSEVAGGIGVLTGSVLAMALLRKAASKSKKAIG